MESGTKSNIERANGIAFCEGLTSFFSSIERKKVL